MTSLKACHKSLAINGIDARMDKTVGQPDLPLACLGCSRIHRDHDGLGEDPGINAAHQMAGT